MVHRKLCSSLWRTEVTTVQLLKVSKRLVFCQSNISQQYIREAVISSISGMMTEVIGPHELVSATKSGIAPVQARHSL